jgi:glutamyl-tRNA synthetase
MPIRTTRLAPSPTGALHLGNARSFLITWAIARQSGWRLLMRIEDLDGPRIKPESAQQAMDTLRWIGIDWDGNVLTQSHDLSPYHAAMQTLARNRHVYACDLTRTQIEQAASAPHGDEHELRFPPELRPAWVKQSGAAPDACPQTFDRTDTSYRLIVPDRQMLIEDHVKGPTHHNPSREIGDFVVWTRRGTPSYQLAVVVDDARQGVTDVIRGDDLLPSAARQQLLYEALGLPWPRWWHLPLVLGPDGRRLAKRHGDTRLQTYRDLGAAPERIIGLLASWSGISSVRCEMTAAGFLQAFKLARLSRMPVTFTNEDDRWLRGK